MTCRTTLPIVLALLVACEAEPVAIDQGSEAPAPESAATLVAEVPEEFSQSPYIAEWSAEAGFEADRAYAIGWMRYWANRARQEITLYVRDGSKSLGSRKSVEEDSFLLPATRRIGASVDMLIDRSCGHVAEALSNSLAYHQFLVKTSLMQWGHTQRQGQDDARQPSCRSSCDTRIILDPENEPPCSGRGGSGDSSDSGTDPGSEDEEQDQPSDLECETVHAIVIVDDEIIYVGPVEICE